MEGTENSSFVVFDLKITEVFFSFNYDLVLMVFLYFRIFSVKIYYYLKLVKFCLQMDLTTYANPLVYHDSAVSKVSS